MDKEKVKVTTASLLSLVQLFLLVGCNSNEAKCEIKDKHAHVYISEKYFDKYIVSEKLKYYDEWTRTDSTIMIDKVSKKLIDFENENSLYRISLNKDKLDIITSNLVDHYQYRYEYEKTIPDFTEKDISLKREKMYSWTANPDDKKITGETRVAHFMYIGYKIELDDNGEHKIIQSKPMESIDELLDNGYSYVKNNFYILVDPNTKEPLSYEDINLNVMYNDYNRGYFEPEILFNNDNTNNKPKVKILERKK